MLRSWFLWKLSPCGSPELITHPRHQNCWSNKTQMLRTFCTVPQEFSADRKFCDWISSAAVPLIRIFHINESHLICLYFIEKERICMFYFNTVQNIILMLLSSLFVISFIFIISILSVIAYLLFICLCFPAFIFFALPLPCLILFLHPHSLLDLCIHPWFS